MRLKTVLLLIHSFKQRHISLSQLSNIFRNCILSINTIQFWVRTPSEKSEPISRSYFIILLIWHYFSRTTSTKKWLTGFLVERKCNLNTWNWKNNKGGTRGVVLKKTVGHLTHNSMYSKYVVQAV